MLNTTTSNSTFDPGLSNGSVNFADVTNAVWRRKWYLVASLAICLFLGTIYLGYAQPTYSVASRILVQPEGSPLTDSLAQRPEMGFIATQGEIISSPTVIQSAVDSMPLPLTLDPTTSPVLAVQDNLRVKPVEGTNVLSLTYQCQNSFEGIKLVESILESYRQFSHQRSADTHLEAFDLLTRNEEQLRAELQQRENRYRELRKKSPLIGDGKNAAVFQVTMIEQLGRALTTARNRRIDFQHRMKLLGDNSIEKVAEQAPQLDSEVTVFRVPSESEKTETVNIWPVSQSFSPTDAGATNQYAALDLMGNMRMPGVEDATVYFRELFLAEANKRELAMRYGPQHPAIHSAKVEIQIWKNRLSKLNDQAANIIRQELDAAINHEHELVELYEKERQQAKSNDEFLVVETQELDGIERLKTTHDSILVQLNNLRLLQPNEDGGLRTNMTILEAPTIGSGPIWPKAPVVLILCCMLGLLGGLGMIFMLERPAGEVSCPTEFATQRNRREYSNQGDYVNSLNAARTNGKHPSVDSIPS